MTPSLAIFYSYDDSWGLKKLKSKGFRLFLCLHASSSSTFASILQIPLHPLQLDKLLNLDIKKAVSRAIRLSKVLNFCFWGLPLNCFSSMNSFNINHQDEANLKIRRNPSISVSFYVKDAFALHDGLGWIHNWINNKI